MRPLHCVTHYNVTYLCDASTRKATDFFKQDCDSRDTKRVLDEDNEDYGQTQCEATVPNQTRAERDDKEEDYGYN